MDFRRATNNVQKLMLPFLFTETSAKSYPNVINHNPSFTYHLLMILCCCFNMIGPYDHIKTHIIPNLEKNKRDKLSSSTISQPIIWEYC